MQDAVNEWVWIYFVVLIVLGSFFAVNLALAVLYLQFTESTQMLEASAKQEQRRTRARSSIAATAVAAARTESKRSRVPACFGTVWSKVSGVCFRVQAHPWFEGATMFLIIFNTLVMASEYHGMADWHRNVRSPSQPAITYRRTPTKM